MNILKKIFAILALIILILSFNYSFAISTGTTTSSTGSTVVKVDGIDFLDEKTFSIKLSKMLNGISKDSEVKILEDGKVVSSTKDEKNLKKVLVKLDFDLIDNSNYSLVSVSEGLDTSIDFNLSGNKSKILNSNTLKDKIFIEYLSVIDPKNIEVYFNKDLNLNNIEFKILKELKTQSIFLDTTNLNVKMQDSLASKKNYIAVFLLKDESNKDIEIENSFYDFTTPEFISIIPENSQIVDTVKPNTNTGSDVVSNTNISSGEVIENVAMKAQTTPNTGTKTNILLFLAIILTPLFLFFLKKSLEI